MRAAALVVFVGLACAPARAEEPPKLDGSRAALEIPEEVWREVLADAGRAGGRIGYTADEMRAFGKDAHLLRQVQGMFADVRRIPRETGRITDGLLEHASKPSEVIARGYALTDVSAGRMYEPPKDLTWGSKELEGRETVDDALRGLVTSTLDGDHQQLPVAVRRLIVDLYVALAAARPWLTIVPPGRSELGRNLPPTEQTRSLEVEAEMKLWSSEENGQAATKGGARFPDERTRASTAYASVILAVHLERAIERYRSSPEEDRAGAASKPVELSTAEGAFWIGDSGPTKIEGNDWAVVIDTGGDDTVAYGGAAGRHVHATPIALYVDLGGNDTYRSAWSGTLAAGVRGIGMIVDLEGDDTYDAKSSSLGCGLYGTGLLWDLAGNDSYRSRGPWGQGCGHVGVGALIDLEGDDDYDCVEQAQGLGGTLGAGLLVDVKGNDTYTARDDGNVSALYLGQSVAMAQGCGYGRRADIGDGYSLAGGVGILVDGAGDDRYHAQVWAQGCGYWWALGVLEDRGGNDTYENGKYSAGAAAHFAIGVCVDLAGDDQHNTKNTTAKNQWQGHARDGSIGVFVDGDGDDAYDVNNHCAGAADLNSIGLFWDRRGDDIYTFHDQDLGEPNGWNDTGAFGAVTRYKPFRSFRDDLPSWGLFLDTGGKDAYAIEKKPRDFPVPAADGTRWATERGPLVFGLGYDLPLYR